MINTKFDMYTKSVKTCNLTVRFLKYIVMLMILSKVVALQPILELNFVLKTVVKL